jgi:hypothetical protein
VACRELFVNGLMYLPVGSTSCVEEVVTVLVTVVWVNGPGGMNGPLTATDTCSGKPRYYCMLKRKWVHDCGHFFTVWIYRKLLYEVSSLDYSCTYKVGQAPPCPAIWSASCGCGG